MASFDPGAGVNTAGAATMLGANPYFAAGFGLAGAFGGGGSDRLPKISMERADLETDINAFRVNSMAQKTGVHPMVAMGANPGGGQSSYISGQPNWGSRAKNLSAALLDRQQVKESNARIGLLEAQKKRIENPVQVAATASDVTRLGAAAGFTNDLPAASEPNQPTTRGPGKSPVLQPQEINLASAFKAPRAYTQEDIESQFGGIWGEAFGLWKGVHNLGGSPTKEFNKRASKIGVKIVKGKFYRLTKRGWRLLEYNK